MFCFLYHFIISSPVEETSPDPVCPTEGPSGVLAPSGPACYSRTGERGRAGLKACQSHRPDLAPAEDPAEASAGLQAEFDAGWPAWECPTLKYEQMLNLNCSLNKDTSPVKAVSWKKLKRVGTWMTLSRTRAQRRLPHCIQQQPPWRTNFVLILKYQNNYCWKKQVELGAHYVPGI